jgi:hypothetical protein
VDKDAQLVLRLPLELHERLKGYATRLSDELELPVTIAAAARRLLHEGLTSAGLPRADASAEPPPAQPKRGRGRPPKR